MLRQNGYRTVCLGKWHLGMDMPLAGSPPNNMDAENIPALDYSKTIQNGPTTRGFDYFHGLAGSLDMPPFVFIENDRFTAPATVEKNFFRTGPASADFEAEKVLPEIAARAIREMSSAKSGQPVFLYLALTSPHTPIVPTAEWRGQSGLNAYADFVMQTDDCIGHVVAALDRAGLASNTLVMVTSDNGCSPAAGVKELEAKKHFPSAQFRGYKADIWAGGHRIPLLARWPGQIAAGTRSDQLVCLNDVMATCAELLDVQLPTDAAEDSVSFLPALRGEKSPLARTTLVHHSVDGSFAIRDGRWKLVLCSGSGGWSDPQPGSAMEEQLPPVQLYELNADSSERTNVEAQHPEIVARLKSDLELIVHNGRSTPGPSRTNDVPVQLVHAPEAGRLSARPN
jgi:arylsulfatase A-like enzyme